MKPIITIGIAAAIGLAGMPASAVDIGTTLEAAKLVLKGRKLLKAGESKCGSSLALAPQEDLLLSLAKSRVKKALPLNQYLALDQAVSRETDTASKAPDFCAKTREAKPSILDEVKQAATRFGMKQLGF